MKKVLLAITLYAVSFGVAHSQTDENKKSVFQLSFFTPLGTNGLYSSQYTNKASFNILAGVSKNEEAFTFGGLSNIIMQNATGFQFAGLSNYVGNHGKGFQFAGLININKKEFSGIQLAGLVNTAAGTKGFQLAGLSNVAKDMAGFQFAGLVNTAKNTTGAQFAGLANTAGNVNGFQFAGLINKAKNVTGVQFAGLINIAENSDCPIGLINLVKNGEKGVAITYDGIGSTVASFRSGGKYTYGIIGIGYNHKTTGNSLVTEGGFGAHIPVVSWFRINNEVKASSIGSYSDKQVFNGGYSLIPAFKIGSHFELSGGVSINYMQSWDTGSSKLFPNHSLWKKSTSSGMQQVYIGYQAGVQYLF